MYATHCRGRNDEAICLIVPSPAELMKGPQAAPFPSHAAPYQGPDRLRLQPATTLGESQGGKRPGSLEQVAGLAVKRLLP